MQTLPEVIEFISLTKLDIDTTNLEEDFNAEQRAAAKSSILLPTGPAAIGTSRKPDVTAAGALKEISWKAPVMKNKSSMGPADEKAVDDLQDMSLKLLILTNEMGGEGAAHVTTPCPDILSGGPTAIGAPSKLDVTAGAVIVIIHAAADPLPDPPDPLSGDTVDAAPMVAPTTHYGYALCATRRVPGGSDSAS